MKIKNIIIGTLLGISTLTPLNASGGVGDLANLGYNACYTKRRLPINYDLAFDTMKDLFVKTNINLVNLSKKDGFMYGKGSWKSGDSVYNITITVNFKNMGDITQINAKASYSIMKKEYETDTGGIAGINFPMPVLWKKTYNVQTTGNIVDPNFYMGFYLNYQKVLFDNLMTNGKILLNKPKKIKITKEKNVTKVVVTKPIIKPKETNITKAEDLNVTKTPITTENNVTKTVITKEVPKAVEKTSEIKKDEVKKVEETTKTTQESTTTQVETKTNTTTNVEKTIKEEETK